MEDMNGALSLIYFFNNPRIFPSQAALASTINTDMDGRIASEVRKFLFRNASSKTFNYAFTDLITQSLSESFPPKNIAESQEGLHSPNKTIPQ